MPQIDRWDEPGSWHHVGNRGVGRMTLFHQRADYRRFLSLLAREVRTRRIEVHVYCLMGNHFHLLIRSVSADLSASMRGLQYNYAIAFNREREREGAVFGKRFFSRRIDDPVYFQEVVRYIDFNPVGPGLCSRPSAYPWGSAQHYARGTGPPWLTRSWIQAEVAGRSRYEPSDYERVFGRPLETPILKMHEAILASQPRPSSCSPDPVRVDVIECWSRHARLEATNSNSRTALAVPDQIIRIVRETRFPEHLSARSKSKLMRTLEVGLLCGLVGLPHVEVAARCGLSAAYSSQLARSHRALIKDNREYAGIVEGTVRRLRRERLKASGSRLESLPGNRAPLKP